MKKQILLALGSILALSAAHADITYVNAGYSTSVFFTDGNVDGINSYDWDSSNNLFYAASVPGDFGSSFGGFYQAGVGSPLLAASSDFPTATVVTIGNYVYFNTSDFSDQKIYKYGPLGGSPSVSLISTSPNYGLYTRNGQMFMTGSVGFGTNHIYYSDLDSNGDLVSDPAIDLGVTSGSSGPMAFDLQGNLYYAPGYGDQSIYKFSAAELAAAMADPLANPLDITGKTWLDYSSLYGAYSGGTSMVFDANGDLMLTLTNFVDPSLLIKFGVDDLSGNYSNEALTLLEDSGIFGDLKLHNGELYVASGNQIFTVSAVPEPSTYALLFLGLSALAVAGRKKMKARISA